MHNVWWIVSTQILVLLILIKKSHTPIPPVSQKVFENWKIDIECKWKWLIQFFQNSIVCLKSGILLLEKKYCQWFSWSGELTFYLLEKLPAKYQTWKIMDLSVVLSYKNYVTWKMWPVQRAVQTGVHQAFPSTIALWFAEVLWMCTSYFNTQCFKKMCIHELKFYEINNFGCSKDILKWNWHLKIRVPLGEEYYYLQSLDC